MTETRVRVEAMHWTTEAAAPLEAQSHRAVLAVTLTVQTMYVGAGKRFRSESERMVAAVQTHVAELRQRDAAAVHLTTL